MIPNDSKGVICRDPNIGSQGWDVIIVSMIQKVKHLYSIYGCNTAVT